MKGGLSAIWPDGLLAHMRGSIYDLLSMDLFMVFGCAAIGWAAATATRQTAHRPNGWVRKPSALAAF